MAEVNGTNNNSVQNMMDSLSSRFLDNNSATANKTADTVNSFAPTNSKDRTSAILDDLTRRFVNGTNSTAPTSSTDTAQPTPVTPAPKKKKKKKGFFGKLFGGIGKALKGIGGFLKKALPIISTIAMFIPGIGTAVGAALKIATAAMGAIDGIKSGNIFGAITSIAGAFTGGATNALSKLGTVGGYIQKGVDMFKNSGVGSLVTKGFDLFNKGKEWLSNTTAGLGGKVTDWLTSKGGDLLKNVTSGIGGKFGSWLTEKGPGLVRDFASSTGSKVTNWLNDKATSLFDKVVNNPTVQKVRDFFSGGIGKSLLDLFTGKAS